MTHFNHTMIFFKLTDEYKISDIYINHSNCLGHIRAYSNSLMRVKIACNHLPFFKIFSNFVHFCPNFQIFCPFFEKNPCMALLF